MELANASASSRKFPLSEQEGHLLNTIFLADGLL